MVYMGSKSRIAKYIVPIIQECIDDNDLTDYVELFCGGGNIIDKIDCKVKLGYDINKYLIALLNYVQQDKPLLENISREFYNKVKNNKNDYDDWVVGNVAFLSSFNGKGFKGGYANTVIEKTKYGERIRDYYRESKDNLLKQSQRKLFKDTVFKVGEYRDVISSVEFNNCFIYLDPPYFSTVGYDRENNFNHNEFWKIVSNLSKNNYVLVSEEQATDNYVCIWKKETLRSINPNNKSKSTEKLFTHKDGLFYNYWRSKNYERI